MNIGFSQNPYISNITKTRPLGAKLFREDIRTDEQLEERMDRRTSRRNERYMKEIIVAFRNFRTRLKFVFLMKTHFRFMRLENSLSVIVM